VTDTNEDLEYCQVAVSEAKKAKAADPRRHPLVGAVVVKDGKIAAAAHRSEFADGEHAEFTALERKLKDASVVGATVYTTLEPCTMRGHPKVPCVERIIERKVKRVVIGMLDPNPVIRGKGQLRLREASIVTDFFPSELMAELEELNREFIRGQKENEFGELPDSTFIESTRERPLDDWYKQINRVYWNRNLQRSATDLFAHLVEVIGGLSSVASGKKKTGVDPQLHIAKALAWWFALAAKVGVRSVEDMLWDKFPGVCPYCRKDRCLGAQCALDKKGMRGPLWEELRKIGEVRAASRPRRLSEWQRQFARIYPPDQSGNSGPAFGRLMEEMGELSEAVRVFVAEPGYFLSEASDVFAWLMHLQNIRDAIFEAKHWGEPLEVALVTAYPDSCKDCRKKLCSCPPILYSTIGRITHEVPAGRGSYDEGGRFLPPDRASKQFAPKS
jgi:pyrimidine deaminase RibD-like protein